MVKKYIREELHAQATLGLLLMKNGSEGGNTLRSKKSFIQNLVLKEIFKLTMFPSSQTKIDLSILLNLSRKTINVWFQNERQSEKVSLTNTETLTKRSEKVEINALILYRIYNKAQKRLMCINNDIN
ncbi:hypothetical protein P3W45_000605 [Vairimorpha bombi]|jgi:hypothetical protein